VQYNAHSMKWVSNILHMPRKSWKEQLGEQIKAARELRGISQGKLADRVRSGRGSINMYENGKGNPQFIVIARIAAELKADFAVLGCRVAAAELLEPKVPEQLELKYDQDHSVLATVTIRPTKKSLTITTHSDYEIKSA
jgi:transcriptional regulator with XRE-family HTH domain